MAEMPFSNHGGVISCVVQQLRQGDLRQRQTRHRADSKVVCDSVPQAVASRQDGGARWRAGGGWRVEVCQSGRNDVRVRVVD